MYVLCEIIITVTVVGIIIKAILISLLSKKITYFNCFNLPSQHKCLARDLRLAKVDCYSSL